MIDTQRFAVLGNPISHSLSPYIHTAFSQATKKQIHYTAENIPLDGFEVALNEFKQKGFSGLNITSPFKKQAFELMDSVNEHAQEAEAVNTVVFHSNGSTKGYNTDGIGLIKDLTQNIKFSLASKRILILGAGGAVQGVLGPLIRENPASIHVANRSMEKASLLRRLFKADCLGVIPFNQIHIQDFDLVINALPLEITEFEIDLKKDMHCELFYDLTYRNPNSPLLALARKVGGCYYDGLGMLVEQAAEAFFLWHGVRPDTKAILSFFQSKQQ